MNLADINGLRKAAVLLLTMDEELSKEVIKELDEVEIAAIGQEISRLKSIPDEIVRLVHDEFIKKLDKNGSVVDGENKFKSLVKQSLGDEKAEMFIESMESKGGVPGEFLRTCDPRALANTIRGEHPQTVALILSILNSKKACEAIAVLPETIQSEVMMRMAHLERVDKQVLLEIENVLREQLESVGFAEGKQLGGVDVVANILNQMDKTLEGDLLGRIEELNPELADKIKQLMFTFEDLVQLDDKSIQVILKEISSEDLSIALKGASEGIRGKIFTNMSERAATMLKEDIESMGPVRLSDVEQAQVRIAMTAKKLDGEGKIIISRGNERFV
ncbi:MAG: flagellar motor switch protein FliG [Proteobacteria bacterium]|nr:flagellar motor switch protein FliG [Pseudomonadota bacterium]